MSKRPSKNIVFMEMAASIARRSTCARRSVGCILVDNNSHISGTGYNGSARGASHCIDSPCPGADSPSGQDLDLCEAIHAEQNALLQCKDVNNIYACYCTAAPCITCTKLLMNTTCQVIYYTESYPGSGWELWTESRGPLSWLQIPEPECPF